MSGQCEDKNDMIVHFYHFFPDMGKLKAEPPTNGIYKFSRPLWKLGHYNNLISLVRGISAKLTVHIIITVRTVIISLFAFLTFSYKC